ncbi:MAG: peptidase MA family metallohydrolase [Phycisphaerales bacterium]
MMKSVQRPLRTALAALLACAGLALAQNRVQEDGIALSPAVQRALEAGYLTDAERRELRVFHGQWTDTDLRDPAIAAKAALAAGDFNHPALASDESDVLDTAEAMILRGQVREGLSLIEDDGTMRALRLRAQANELLGDLVAVRRVTDIAMNRLARERAEDARELTEGVRLLIIRARTVGVEQGAGDYGLMATLLATVRDELDRLYWPARLAEATLLDARDNRPQAREALMETLALNPSSAAAWRALGESHVRSFNFDAAEAVASELDRIAASVRPGATSPYATLIRARSLLRQKEPRLAAQAVDELLETYPTMRDALALRLAIAAVYRDSAKEQELVALLEELSPGSALPHYEAGKQLADWRQYAPAMEYLEEATKRQPAWPEPWIELGLLAMQAAQDDTAIAALERATALDPFNVRAKNTLRLASELANYERIETEHFTIRYRSGPDAVLAREMAPVMEAIHARITGKADNGLDHEPDRKTVIDLMPSHDWFAVRITGMPDIFTIAASTGPAIAMETPRPNPGSTTQGYDWPRVLQHEYVHTVGLSRTKNRVPHWFTEAQAVFLEDGPWDENRARMLTAALEKDELFPLDELSFGFIRPRRPGDRSLAYAQSAWLYEYLVERFGSAAPLDLMDAYAAGQTQREAFTSVLEIDQDELESDFLAWAARQARGWGLLPPERYPTLDQLAQQYETDTGEQASSLSALLEAYPHHPQLIEQVARNRLEENNGRPTDDMRDILTRWATAVPVADEPRRMLVLLARETGIDPADETTIGYLEHLDARAQYTGAYAAELARLYMQRDESEEALAKANRAVRIEPFDAPLRELAATIAWRAGEFTQARDHVEALTIIEPDRDIHRQRLEAMDQRLGR